MSAYSRDNAADVGITNLTFENDIDFMKNVHKTVTRIAIPYKTGTDKEKHTNLAANCNNNADKTAFNKTISRVPQWPDLGVCHKTGFNNEKQTLSTSNFNNKIDDINIQSHKNENESEERAEWSNQCEFILSTVGYAVGLGNIWRFPYLAYTNGGGSFLIPYVIMLFIAGLPMFFMELVLGQYSRQGPIKVFGRIAPIFKGLGFAMLGVTIFVGIYYNVIIAWTLFYMFKGFTSDLPWADCGERSSIHCVNNFTNANETNMMPNGSFPVGPPEDFFLHQMLGLDKEVYDWDNYGNLRWQMVLCLLGAWTIVCLCLIKGVQSSGKVFIFYWYVIILSNVFEMQRIFLHIILEITYFLHSLSGGIFYCHFPICGSDHLLHIQFKFYARSRKGHKVLHHTRL